MAGRAKRDGRWGCLFMVVGFYLVFRLLFLTTAPGTISSATTVSKRHDSQRVSYTYSIGDKTYHGSDTVSRSYNLHSGTPVKVKYWRFWRTYSALSHWSMPKHKHHTFGAELFRLFLEYVFLPGLAFVIATAFGVPMRRKLKSRKS